jgi:response regulator of citrate/malate metabolism
MPSQANLKAAQAVVLSRARHQKGLSRDASKVSKQPLSLRNAEARHHGSSRATIQRIVKKLEAANSADLNDIAFNTAGRPRILTDEEEEAIVASVTIILSSINRF